MCVWERKGGHSTDDSLLWRLRWKIPEKCHGSLEGAPNLSCMGNYSSSSAHTVVWVLRVRKTGDRAEVWVTPCPCAKDCPSCFWCMCLFYISTPYVYHLIIFINLLNALILSATEGKIIVLFMRKLSCLHISHFIAVLKLVLYISSSMTTIVGSPFPFCSVRSVMGMELEKHFLNGWMMVEARPVFGKNRTH